MIEELLYTTQYILGAGFGKIVMVCLTVLAMYQGLMSHLERSECRKRQDPNWQEKEPE